MKRKRILFVTNHFRFSNGVASVLRSLIDNLDQSRFDVHLLTLYEFNEEFAAPIRDKATFHKGFGFYFRGFDQITKFIPLKLLYKAFVREDYDLEVAFQFGLPTKILSVSPNPNKICWMHTYDSNLTLKNYYRKFPKIVNVAKVGSEKLRKEGFIQADYCYNIIDEEYIVKKASESNNIPITSKKVVVTVCRIDPDKAMLRQIKSIEEIRGIDKKYEFWIVGSGTDFSIVQHYVSKHDLDSYIKLFGRQTNPYKYLAKASLYFCGSLREGFSTACQEAAILGIPIVTTNVDGAKELIEEAQCGRVIENTEESIINNLSEILSNDKLISTWKETAIQNSHKFYKKSRIEKIENILLQHSR